MSVLLRLRGVFVALAEPLRANARLRRERRALEWRLGQTRRWLENRVQTVMDQEATLQQQAVKLAQLRQQKADLEAAVQELRAENASLREG